MSSAQELFQAIGQMFNPADYNYIEAGHTKIRRHNTRHEVIEEAEYGDYDIEELVSCIRKQLERAEPGEKILVDMGISILTAKVVAAEVVNDPGDNVTAPYSTCVYRLEDVRIVEENGRHRRLEEQVISKMEF